MSGDAVGRTILAVEDEFLILEYLGELLTEAGFLVIKASNADEAIEVLERGGEIFAVVTDIDMPGSMDGLKLAAAILDRWPPVHVVITTGKNVAGRVIPDDAHFIPKPYTPERMLRLVNALG